MTANYDKVFTLARRLQRLRRNGVFILSVSMVRMRGKHSQIEPRSRCTVDLTIWLPAMFLLGLATFGLMFACVPGCDKV